MTGPNGTIRVLLVDDSPLVLELITRILEADPDIRVVGTATDGSAGLKAVAELDPDVVCADLHMPVMNGLEFTRRVMRTHAVPVLVVSVSVHPDETENIFEAVSAGAVDVFPKPTGGFRVDSPEADELRRRVRVVSGVRVFKRHTTYSADKDLNTPRDAVAPPQSTVTPLGIEPFRVIGIGASTGGPRGFASILGCLPDDFPVPILGVQHISNGFTDSFVRWLRDVTPLAVEYAVSGEKPQPGHVYFAPEDQHLLMDAGGRLRCALEANSALVDSTGTVEHRPSVDVLFSSLARYGRSAAVGVLLSGMGVDGAQGLAEIQSAGGLTVAQDEATSVVFGMPGEAIRLGVAQHILPIESIGPFLSRIGSKQIDLQERRANRWP